MYSLLCLYNPLLLFQLNNNKYILKIFVILFSTGKKKKVCNNTRGCKCWHFIVGWTVRVNPHIVECLWSWIYRDLWLFTHHVGRSTLSAYGVLRLSFDAVHTQTLPLWFLDQTMNAACVMPHCSATEMFWTYLFARDFINRGCSRSFKHTL